VTVLEALAALKDATREWADANQRVRKASAEMVEAERRAADLQEARLQVHHKLTMAILAETAEQAVPQACSMPGGKEARANLAQLLPAGTPVSLHSVKNDKYGGRFDAVIYLAGVNITTTLINTGWAAAWDGVGTAPIPAWPR
jgi:hypothetical protein